MSEVESKAPCPYPFVNNYLLSKTTRTNRENVKVIFLKRILQTLTVYLIQGKKQRLTE